MTELIREIQEKKRSSVIILENGEQFWLTRGQLAEWGERLNIPCIKGIENGDPSAAIVDGCRYAKENNIDILLCDTAGRLQNKAGLMNELSKMTVSPPRKYPVRRTIPGLFLMPRPDRTVCRRQRSSRKQPISPGLS